MSIYLEEFGHEVRQYYKTRRAPINGIIGVHTSQSTSARATAHYIATRTDAGSYHSIVDHTETIHVGRYEWTMFGARGHNTRVLHLAFGTYAAQWNRLPRETKLGMLDRGAAEAARMAEWAQTTHGINIPAVRLTRKGVDAGHPGFAAHAILDPERRYDPGQDFPWSYFLTRYEHHRNQGAAAMAPQPTLKVSADRSGTPFVDALHEVQAMYAVYRPDPATWPEEARAWGRDIAAKIYADPPIDIAPTLAYIRHALEQENSQ